MKNKLLLIIFVISLHMVSIAAMDGCCDHQNLESLAKSYAANADKISSDGIERDLSFLSPAVLQNASFARYMEENSFEMIAKQAITEPQKRVVEVFTQALKSIKTDPLLKIQLCLLLDRIIINLRPSISINICQNPVLQDLLNNPSVKLHKLLLSPLVSHQ